MNSREATPKQELIKRHKEAATRHSKALSHDNHQAIWYAEGEMETMEWAYRLFYNETITT